MDKKIVEYIVVSGTSTTIINKYVNDYIKNGYQPHGSISVVCGTFGFNIFQPMVKYAE